MIDPKSDEILITAHYLEYINFVVYKDCRTTVHHDHLKVANLIGYVGVAFSIPILFLSLLLPSGVVMLKVKYFCDARFVMLCFRPSRIIVYSVVYIALC